MLKKGKSESGPHKFENRFNTQARRGQILLKSKLLIHIPAIANKQFIFRTVYFTVAVSLFLYIYVNLNTPTAQNWLVISRLGYTYLGVVSLAIFLGKNKTLCRDNRCTTTTVVLSIIGPSCSHSSVSNQCPCLVELSFTTYSVLVVSPFSLGIKGNLRKGAFDSAHSSETQSILTEQSYWQQCEDVSGHVATLQLRSGSGEWWTPLLRKSPRFYMLFGYMKHYITLVCGCDYSLWSRSQSSYGMIYPEQ